MSTFHTTRIFTLAELRRRAVDWDDLWSRSDVALPLLRAELIVGWIKQFSQSRRFRAIAVESDGRLVAALPLVRRRIRGPLTAWTLPANDWSQSGDLMWDAEAGEEPLHVLAAALARETRTLAWFNAVDLHSPRWSAFRRALESAALPLDVHERYEVGVTNVNRDFEQFTAGLSGNFRRNVRRRMRNLDARGGCAFRRVLNPTGGELESLLDTAFQIERQSWKGTEGTSILQSPGMAEFFTRQSRQVAALGELYLDFLDVAGRPVAFELGYIAKGRQFAHKISYLDEFTNDAPGHALRWLQLQHLAAEGNVKTFDNFGKLSEAAEAWSTGTYTIGRLVVASRRWSSRAIFSLYRRALPLLRTWRERRQARRERNAQAFAEHAAKTQIHSASESDATKS